MAEGLFDDDARALRGAGADELFDDGAEERGRDGEVMRGMFGVAEFAADGLEGGDVGVVTVDVAQKGAELGPGVGIDAAVGLDAGVRALFELIERPAGLGDADDGYIEGAAAHHRLQCRKDFLVGKISGGPEENKCV